jgi:hypothetical protein
MTSLQALPIKKDILMPKGDAVSDTLSIFVIYYPQKHLDIGLVKLFTS